MSNDGIRVPGPVFALKQLGDTVRVPAQTLERHHE